MDSFEVLQPVLEWTMAHRIEFELRPGPTTKEVIFSKGVRSVSVKAKTWKGILKKIDEEKILATLR